MKYELFKRFFLACMIVFVVCFSLILLVLSASMSNRSDRELCGRAEMTAALVNAQGEAILTALPADDSLRTTLIAADGTVISDSALNPATLENHSDREEFQEALASGSGRASRYSTSILQRTDYYALRLENGDVLRISMQQDSLVMLLLSLTHPMLITIVLLVVLSLLLANRFSRSIMAPIDAIDLENPDDRDVYDEMKPFIHRIVSQNQQIYRQMNELREETKKQDEMRREFTANVSHELKTPLTSISGFAEIIRDGMVQEKDLPHFADNIYQEAQRMIVLVNDILKLSRLEDAAPQQEERQHVELLALCQEIEARLALPAKKASITMTCDGSPVEIYGIPRIIEEILFNLCDNAIKYNRPGGTVTVTVQPEDNEAVVRIRDTGIGIPEEDKPRIFERFYRVNKSHSKEVGGTGLGLSIVKHGMALHGAAISLESRVDEGTVITLRFPPG